MKKMKLDIQLFNGSCSIQSITETTNINTNQSTFTITAKTSVTGATYNGQKGAYMTAQWKYASASEWTSLTQQKFSISKESSVTKSWDLILDHNADGTLENINVRIKWYVTSSTNGTTGATNVTPTTIPRASIPTLSSSSVNMGSSVTIYTNRYSSSFTHTIRYAFGNANGTIASNVATSIIWTPSLTLANQIPSSISGVGTIYCDTYNGSTLIGTKTINITLNVPSSIVPTTSFTQVQEAGSVPSSWGIYVKSKSKVALAISGSGSYGSSISAYRISYYGGAVTTSSATTSFLTQSGSTTFTGQVTDTRGRSASTTTSINVVDYSNPTISTAQVQRCNANGVIDNNGEYMYISYGASISSCSSKNTPSAVYKVGYRVHNTGNYTYVNLTTNANSYSASGVLFSDGIKAASSSGTKVQFSTNNTYDIQFYVKDYFMEYTNVQSLDAGFDLMNFNASGKAMAIGKVSEATGNNELFEVGMDTNITGTLAVDKIDNTKGLYWKENGYGDKFKIVPNFNGYDDDNSLQIQSAVGGAGTDPTLSNIAVITGKSGNAWVKGRLATDTSFRIPANSNNGYGLVDHANNSIIKDWNNGTITMNATGGQLYLGHQNTSSINILDGKANIDSSGRVIAPRFHTIDLTWGGAGNQESGYRKIATFSTPASWSNHRMVFAVASRHTGGGIVSVACGNNSSTANNNYGVITYYGPTGSGSIVDIDSFKLYKKSDGTEMYLYWRYQDYNNTSITLLSTTGTTLSNGTWTTSPSETWHCNTTINNVVSLYDNSSGTNGTITLSETSANFSYIDIQFRSNDGENFVNSQRIYNPNGKYTTLLYSYTGDNNGYLYQKARTIYISGTSISTHATNRYSEATIKTSSASASKINNIYITKVMGYR